MHSGDLSNRTSCLLLIHFDSDPAASTRSSSSPEDAFSILVRRTSAVRWTSAAFESSVAAFGALARYGTSNVLVVSSVALINIGTGDADALISALASSERIWSSKDARSGLPAANIRKDTSLFRFSSRRTRTSPCEVGLAEVFLSLSILFK